VLADVFGHRIGQPDDRYLDQIVEEITTIVEAIAVGGLDDEPSSTMALVATARSRSTVALVTAMARSIRRSASTDRLSARPVAARAVQAPITTSGSAKKITTGTRSKRTRITKIR
jgi:hypothetical protein